MSPSWVDSVACITAHLLVSRKCEEFIPLVCNVQVCSVREKVSCYLLPSIHRSWCHILKLLFAPEDIILWALNQTRAVGVFLNSHTANTGILPMSKEWDMEESHVRALDKVSWHLIQQMVNCFLNCNSSHYRILSAGWTARGFWKRKHRRLSLPPFSTIPRCFVPLSARCCW